MATATGPASNRGQALLLPGTDSTHRGTRKMLYQTSGMEQPGGQDTNRQMWLQFCVHRGIDKGKAKNILEHWFSHLQRE